MERELGPKVTLLQEIECQPVAAGSMSQVHSARLADGTEVVVKVQRPGLERVIRQDLRLLRFAARWLVRIHPSLEAVNPVGLVEDFAQSLGQQLSFRTEVANMVAMRRTLRAYQVVVPRVWKDLSTDHLLVMERAVGVRIDQPEALDAIGIERRSVLESLVSSFLASALGSGTFHGDLHAGNMLVRPDGQLVLFDFGAVGRLEAGARRAVTELLTTLVEFRFDSAALALLDLVDATSADLAAVALDVQCLVASLMSKPISEIDTANAVGILLRTAGRHHLVLPQEVVAFFKQMLFLDGICRALEPSFDLFLEGVALLESSLAAA